jgi:hypothetical protein
VAKPATIPPRPTLTPQQYEDAYVAYCLYAEGVCEQLRADHKQYEFEVNLDVAMNVAVATYDDIDRYKDFHLRNATPGARADAIKRAAYFAKWTVKLRPIFYYEKGRPKDDPEDMALMANEILAAAYAIELIGSELKKHLKYSDKTLAELLYDLHYRNMTDDALLAIFHMIRDLVVAGGKNPIVEIGVS